MRSPCVAAALVALGLMAIAGAAGAVAATKGSDVVTPVPAPGSQARTSFALLPAAPAAGRGDHADRGAAQRQRPPDRRARRRDRRVHERRHRRQLRHSLPEGDAAPAGGSRCRLPRSRCSRARRARSTSRFGFRLLPRPASTSAGSGCTCRLTTPSDDGRGRRRSGDVRDHAAGRAHHRGGDRRAGDRQGRICR